jgi:hypothetical protein
MSTSLYMVCQETLMRPLVKKYGYLSICAWTSAGWSGHRAPLKVAFPDCVRKGLPALEETDGALQPAARETHRRLDAVVSQLPQQLGHRLPGRILDLLVEPQPPFAVDRGDRRLTPRRSGKDDMRLLRRPGEVEVLGDDEEPALVEGSGDGCDLVADRRRVHMVQCPADDGGALVEEVAHPLGVEGGERRVAAPDQNTRPWPLASSGSM